MSEDIKRSISLSCGDLSAHDVAARHRAAATNIFNVFFIRILFELKPFLYFRPFKAVAEQAVLEVILHRFPCLLHIDISQGNLNLNRSVALGRHEGGNLLSAFRGLESEQRLPIVHLLERPVGVADSGRLHV